MRTTGNNRRFPSRRAALLGLLFALAVVLSLLEGALPPLAPVPGIKPGLANVAVMFCATSVGIWPAFLLAALKALFAGFARGAVAGVLSFSGGALSVLAMAIVLRALRLQNAFALSVAGAVAHNLGQLAAAGMILGLWAVFWYYLAILLAAGIAMGLLTGFVFKALEPYLRRIAS